MISAATSWDSSWAMWSAPRSVAARADHSASCSSQRAGYSSSGMAKCSVRSGRPCLMNQDTYSARCSELSVQNQPRWSITS